MNHDRTRPCVHVCIATGQNAANFIPLQQYDAREVWILQTPAMNQSAKHLEIALRQDGRTIERKKLDDNSPAALSRSAERIAEELDGRHVVLHATGGTKLMVMALRDGLRLVETGSGRLDIVYADTQRQQIDWLGAEPRSEAMADVIDLKKMLLLQGYRIQSDSRHHGALQRASEPSRAQITRSLGDKASRYGAFLSALAGLGRQACDSPGAPRDLVQRFRYTPGGAAAELLRRAVSAGLLRWDEDVMIEFPDGDIAAYFAGGWIEEYVLLKLNGMFSPSQFGSNLQVVSAERGVPNELDAMVVHRNRALIIECKTGRQDKPAAALYKLAQLRDHLGGSVAAALYLSAQELSAEHKERAGDYRIKVLCAGELASLPGWLGRWRDPGPPAAASLQAGT